MEAYKDAIVAYGWFYPIAEFLGMLALALLLAYGGFRVRGGALQIGVVVAFFQYGMRFFRPIQDLSEKYNIMQSAMAAAERVFKLLDTPVEIQSPAQAVALSAIARGRGIRPRLVRLQRRRLGPERRQLPHRAGRNHRRGGPHRRGENHPRQPAAALLRSAARRHPHRRHRYPRFRTSTTCAAISASFLQDPHLFTGTIAENIRLGHRGHFRRPALRAPPRASTCWTSSRRLPEGFDQPVRERGAGYSTGQKQLINFARALAHNPRFLILDEATSSVDTETELRIREALEQLVEGRTSIVIAHRLSTIQRADRIIVMHKGRLREIGTHQELLALRGIYWKLYQLQYKDQEIGSAQLAEEQVTGD